MYKILVIDNQNEESVIVYSPFRPQKGDRITYYLKSKKDLIENRIEDICFEFNKAGSLQCIYVEVYWK